MTDPIFEGFAEELEKQSAVSLARGLGRILRVGGKASRAVAGKAKSGGGALVGKLKGKAKATGERLSFSAKKKGELPRLF